MQTSAQDLIEQFVDFSGRARRPDPTLPNSRCER
jgi:hypothetical protein